MRGAVARPLSIEAAAAALLPVLDCFSFWWGLHTDVSGAATFLLLSVNLLLHAQV